MAGKNAGVKRKKADPGGKPGESEGALVAAEAEAAVAVADAPKRRARKPKASSTGGGKGALEDARPRGYFVYLKARAEVAAGRAEPSGTRPVLMGDDPLARMRELFTARDPYYAKADATVQTEAKPAEKVADEVVRLAQISAGW